MKTLQDYQGLAIRLTDERLAHILEHPEMATLTPAIEETLRRPQFVIQSLGATNRLAFITVYMWVQWREINISALSSRSNPPMYSF